MKKRLLENWLTTALGVVCVGGAIYMYLSANHTQMEAAELGALGLVFLRSKDSIIGVDRDAKK
jgi:hypothetical protein